MQQDTDDLSMSVPLNTLPSPRDYRDSFQQEFELKQQKNGNNVAFDYDWNQADGPLLEELLN